MITRNDVAAAAGVSPSTVSYVLNDGPRSVSEAIKERVWKAVRELGYHPNAVARSLRTARVGMVGLMVPDISNPFFAGLSRGAQDVAKERGYFVVVCNTDGKLDQEISLMHSLYEHRLEGMIVDPVEVMPKDLTFLQDREVPVVLSGLDREQAIADCAGVDDTEAAADAVSHLLELGHIDIALITGPLKLRRMNNRPDGYRKALAGRGIPWREELVTNGSYSQVSGYECARELAARKVKFTAVFAANDLMAIGAMAAFQELGMRVPEDVALIGFDNIPESNVATPRLSTVDNPHYTQGRVAAEMLFERINGEFTGEPRAVVLPHRLIIRGSTVAGRQG
ncbi:MAG TPA: LacI family DNA-binding transcriptional regulator [Spirochaetia bacterium]|nr:LacI family DNA-binding transcriptional regulator [Spirochaetia bacterium]